MMVTRSSKIFRTGSWAPPVLALSLVFGALLAPEVATAQDRAPSFDGRFSSLATDRVAAAIGDTLTVLIYEDSAATNSTRAASNRNNHLQAQALTDKGDGGSVQLGLQGGFNGVGETGRSERFIAQVSVVVVGVEPNGDLRIAGEQRLQLGSEMTIIRVKGKVRPQDVTSTNTVTSTRLADADIAYIGNGFASRAANRGPIGHVLGWLGL